jgi:polyisoprenyl-phosphate glycosyltransferase
MDTQLDSMDTQLDRRSHAAAMPQSDRPDVALSVVAPIHNEAEILPHFYCRVTAVMERLGESYELLLVDDGSRDDTPELLRRLAQADPHVRVVRFSRNFGHQMALCAGLDYAHGRAVIMLDADLQDPPEVIPALVAQWRAGAEVVYAQRTRRRGETAFKRLTAAAFYRLIRRITAVDIPPDVGDFRLLDRRVVDALVTLRERRRFLRGLSAWVGYRQVAVPYERQERAAGRTKYSLKNMVRLALDAITSFSDVPVELAMASGAALTGLSLLAGVVMALLALFHVTIGALAVVALLVVFLAGIQLTFLGVAGAYLVRIYDEVRARPLYIASEVLERAASTTAQPHAGAGSRPMAEAASRA